MRHRLTTHIHIAATRAQVWSHLTDLDSYPDWNPFITSAEGTLEVGSRLTIMLEPPGGGPMQFRPRITVLEPGVTLEWLGRVGLPGLFDGRHRFDLTPMADGTRLVHSESFSGLLVPTQRATLDGPTLRGFEAMNQALARRAAQTAAA